MTINDLIGKLVRDSVLAVGLYAGGCGGENGREGFCQEAYVNLCHAYDENFDEDLIECQQYCEDSASPRDLSRDLPRDLPGYRDCIYAFCIAETSCCPGRECSSSQSVFEDCMMHSK